MRTKDTALDVFPVDMAAATPLKDSASVVTIVSLNSEGTPSVQIDEGGPVIPARLAFRATREQIQSAILQRQQAVVLFENGDTSKPLIVGLIEMLAPSQPQAPFVEADIDGRRMQVTAQDEIVLRCGAASITLRRNGRVIIRGTYVETDSQGTNRIKGGQVQIN
jgi:hypothetical protein